MPEELQRALLRAGEELGARASRRRLLERAAIAVGALVGLPAAAQATKRRHHYLPGTKPIAGGWYGFCGHTYTTASCAAPFSMPRIDAHGFPLRPQDGHCRAVRFREGGAVERRRPVERSLVLGVEHSAERGPRRDGTALDDQVAPREGHARPRRGARSWCSGSRPTSRRRPGSSPRS